MPRPYHHYTDDDIANALATLAANDGNVERTARDLGIPPANIRKWRNSKEISTVVVEKCERKRTALADTFENAAYELLNGVTKAKIKKASVQALLTAAGIAVDKMRLLREQATSISSQTMSDEQRAERLMGLAERIRQRRNGFAHAGGANGLPQLNGPAPMAAPADEPPPAAGV